MAMMIWVMANMLWAGGEIFDATIDDPYPLGSGYGTIYSVSTLSVLRYCLSVSTLSVLSTFTLVLNTHPILYACNVYSIVPTLPYVRLYFLSLLTACSFSFSCVALAIDGTIIFYISSHIRILWHLTMSFYLTFCLFFSL